MQDLSTAQSSQPNCCHTYTDNNIHVVPQSDLVTELRRESCLILLLCILWLLSCKSGKSPPLAQMKLPIKTKLSQCSMNEGPVADVHNAFMHF